MRCDTPCRFYHPPPPMDAAKARTAEQYGVNRQGECRRYPTPKKTPADYGCGEFKAPLSEEIDALLDGLETDKP